MGADLIAGADVNPKKFALAKQLAARRYNPQDYLQQLMQQAAGESPTGFGWDYTFDCM